ncbi:MAG TPA: hypothetical protein ENF52_00400 [Chloroflexi bacterium]|nr:hypothetical protein [Chloroflexota bacterium]
MNLREAGLPHESTLPPFSLALFSSVMTNDNRRSYTTDLEVQPILVCRQQPGGAGCAHKNEEAGRITGPFIVSS